MRDGILPHLPDVIPHGKTVVVVGSERTQGLSYLKQYIHKLDRGGQWIEPIFKEVMPSGSLARRACLVLTMSSMGGGALVNVRRDARDAGIPCPMVPLTNSEIKGILELLSTRLAPPPKPLAEQDALPNGVHQNGNNHANVHETTETLVGMVTGNKSLAKVLVAALPATRTEAAPATKPPERTTPPVIPESHYDAVESSFSLLEKSAPMLGKLQQAIGDVLDQVRSADEARRTLCDVRSEIVLKDLRITELEQEVKMLSGKLATQQAEMSRLVGERGSMSSELERLKTKLAGFQKLLND